MNDSNPKPRDHTACDAGCMWCAVRRAMASREGYQGQAGLPDPASASVLTIYDLARDIDQLCNFVGDLIANIPNDRGAENMARLAQGWIASRAKESRVRNQKHPVWLAQWERANGKGGSA